MVSRDLYFGVRFAVNRSKRRRGRIVDADGHIELGYLDNVCDAALGGLYVVVAARELGDIHGIISDLGICAIGKRYSDVARYHIVYIHRIRVGGIVYGGERALYFVVDSIYRRAEHESCRSVVGYIRDKLSDVHCAGRAHYGGDIVVSGVPFRHAVREVVWG